MNGNPPPPDVLVVPDFKDRRTGLIIFGIMEMILGGLAALMVPLMVAGQLMALMGDAPSPSLWRTGS